MKKIFITILLAALMPFAAGAQDARQRTAETIVADALAQLPAQGVRQPDAGTRGDRSRRNPDDGRHARARSGRQERPRGIRHQRGGELRDRRRPRRAGAGDPRRTDGRRRRLDGQTQPGIPALAAATMRNGGRSPRIREIRRGRIPRRLRRARTDLHARNRRGDPRTDRRKPGPGRPAGLCRRGEAPCGRRARAAEMGRRPQGRHADESGCL